MSTKPVSKKFGKSTRDVPAAADKAKKWYNPDDDAEPKKVSLR
jgi:large subunit ribosomal protein L6e